jgi:hypothetical protein
MKPAPFVRHVPRMLDQVLTILAEVAPPDGAPNRAVRENGSPKYGCRC